MTRYLLSLLPLLAFMSLSAQGPFPPAAGQTGSNAIAKDSSIIKSWATGVDVVRGYVQISDTSVYAAGSNRATFGKPSNALQTAEGNSVNIVSLGDGGMATLTFDRLIVDGPGADFAVFENSFGDTFLEVAFVEVSSDGIHFSRFPAISLTDSDTQIGPWDEIDPTNLHNLAGKYRQGFGTPFDLSEIPYDPLVDVNAIRFVRIIDVVGSIDAAFATYDSEGNIINDPYPTPFDTGGFDLDGVAVINGNVQNSLVNFNGLALEPESYFFPSGVSSFTSGPLSFRYDGSEGFWSGFAYSNLSSLNGAYDHDQFASASLTGMDGDSTNYAVAFVASDWLGGTYDPIPSIITVTDGNAASFSGFYINNNEMAYITMRDGTMFNKKFGGDSGNDPDWFRVKIWGIRADNTVTEPIYHYLADFRFDDNTLDYIQDSWKWVDLQSMGMVKELRFTMESTDSGDFGINTPAYFCMDNLTVMELQGPFVKMPIEDMIIAENASPIKLELNHYFNASGCALTYEVSSDNTSLITAGVTVSLLTLTPLPNSTGQAEITVNAYANGMSVTDNFTVTISTNVGIDEATFLRPKVYPNPTTSLLNVEVEAGSGLKLYNSSGQLLLEKRTVNAKTQLSLEGYVNGIYLLIVEGVHGNSTLKISKN
ncbi:MAG: DUF4465 domain-containing protein [Lentimicrobiaceae bacterium]|jgi:hypothetical protein|nr:DUF4465 domain-containing protein [Lentimicrobiaceae bacterium]MDD4598950.1 DUF4465 domain-containing protein [Lentimicrobiaceae bacterium]MDY0026720.1 DUF4465 domain-containing protein [Lentimicrobium sp.]